jgi:dipeptidyl aminopeptidase/acylaminoacyl peptidase
MGLARYPDLYRCGFQWAGVTDLDLMYTSRWSDMSEMSREYGMPALLGDRVRDAKQLAETSPVNLAAKIRQPLLMAYGRLDRRVPIQHGARMRDALAAHNSRVEWIEYPDEAHGWWFEATEVDFWTRVERFLDKSLNSRQ